MSVSLRTRVNSEMLCAGCCLWIVQIITLKTSYISHTKLTCKIWILAVCLMATAPSWVTEDIYVWSPISKTLVDISVTML